MESSQETNLTGGDLSSTPVLNLPGFTANEEPVPGNMPRIQSSLGNLLFDDSDNDNGPAASQNPSQQSQEEQLVATFVPDTATQPTQTATQPTQTATPPTQDGTAPALSPFGPG
jgi:hypothetical protein